MTATIAPKEDKPVPVIQIKAPTTKYCSVKQCMNDAVKEFDLGFQLFRLCAPCMKVLYDTIQGPPLPAQSA